MRQSPLVSVIVPVYNVERYLDACISSIVDQTYRNLDIIIIDDVSPDRCPELCDRWAAKDARIRVIHRERNGGLSAARNSGVDAMRGSYVSFVDSDDVIAPEMIETLVSDAFAHDADIVSCGANKVTEDLETVITPMAPPTHTFTGEQALDEFLHCTGNILDCAWGKLYRAALLERSDALRFPIGSTARTSTSTPSPSISPIGCMSRARPSTSTACAPDPSPTARSRNIPSTASPSAK
ncbi:glycosyltransferase [Bifidobacterium stellenboschense]|uniref:glycosyltransferase n=1 Tax=Bifidobacterium stellenboschense TaxID=762211 RepID=UPI000A0638BB|nr:glycosyltransferase [Bifidobacterium stellenboschense]